jgi:adenine phosphoribosyltransferase
MSEDLKKYIRSVKDFPKPGIMFRDITTILKNPIPFKLATRLLFEHAENLDVNKVIGIESRGFIFGSLLAEKLDAGAETVKETYSLEYGTDSIEIHRDAIQPGDKVLLHDDLLATGGTAEAACKLIEKLGGKVMQISFIIELSFLKGREKLKNYNVISLVDYDSE